jgi:YHS domain-containing protein
MILKSAENRKEVNTTMFGNEAINGYDPVAYFTSDKAIIGNKTFTHSWKDATWYFSSQENLDLFKTSPEKYAPQFGGYCAFAVSKGFTANTDPEAFKIIDGKLYLCADKEMLNNWMQEGEESRRKLEDNWK